MGPIENAKIGIALEEVAYKKDFGGISFTANFATDYFPYSFITEDRQLRGIFYDALNTASKILNITLKYQDPLPQNFDIWSKT